MSDSGKLHPINPPLIMTSGRPSTKIQLNLNDHEDFLGKIRNSYADRIWNLYIYMPNQLSYLPSQCSVFCSDQLKSAPSILCWSQLRAPYWPPWAVLKSKVKLCQLCLHSVSQPLNLNLYQPGKTSLGYPAFLSMKSCQVRMKSHQVRMNSY